METKKNKPLKRCHFRNDSQNTAYYPHQINDSECISVICDELNKGLSMEQIWKKEFKHNKKDKEKFDDIDQFIKAYNGK